MACNATTTCEPTSTGSMAVCGRAAWPPLPRTVIETRSAAASTVPATTAASPSGIAGSLWMPYTASHGKRRNRPSSTITLPPPPPSSAG